MIGGIDAVNGSITGNAFGFANQRGQRGQPVRGGEHSLTLPTRSDVVGPADYRAHTIAALVGRSEEIAAPRSVRATAHARERRSRIVARPHYDSVIFNPSSLEHIEDLAGSVVQLR